MKYAKSIAIILVHILTAASLSGQTKPVASSEVIMKQALAEAVSKHKNIFVIFHASWCGWCRKMDNAMNDEKVKSFFDNNYVVVHLTVDENKEKKELENPGAVELRKRYHGEEQGLPYWFILDATGNFLADARLKSGSADADTKALNVGCPASNEEVAYFVKMLQKTSSLNNEQLTLIQERFLKNKEP